MSTYLSQAPTYLPTVQPYQPDMQLYAGTLEMKQTEYDSAHKQISSLYGSMLNSPMMRDENVKARDEFFKTINYEIKKLANLDLSLDENQSQASQLFSSLYDNKYIAKDMMWTKNYYDERERGEAYRNCFTEEDCGGTFWEGGLQVLDYRAQEFRDASKDESLRFGDVNYTPAVNIAARARKIAKEYGMEDIIQQIPTGDGYMIKTKNGPDLAYGPYQSLFTSIFQNDPAVQDYYKAQGYLNRKNTIASKAEELGSIEAAEEAYIKEVETQTEAMFRQLEQSSVDAADVESNEREELERQIEEEGTTGDDALAIAYVEAIQKENRLRSTAEMSKTNREVLYNGRSNASRRAYLENLDSVLGSALFMQDVSRSALEASYINYQVEYSLDPVWAKKMDFAAKKAAEEERVSMTEQAINSFALTPAEAPQPGASDIELDEREAGMRIEEDLTEGQQKFEQSATKANTRLYESLITSSKNRASIDYTVKDLFQATEAVLKQKITQLQEANATKKDIDAAQEKLTEWKSMSNAEKKKAAESGKYIEDMKKLQGIGAMRVYNESFRDKLTPTQSNMIHRRDLLRASEDILGSISLLNNQEVIANSNADQAQAVLNMAANKAKAKVGDSPVAEFLPYMVGSGGQFVDKQTMAIKYVFDEMDRLVGEVAGYDKDANGRPITERYGRIRFTDPKMNNGKGGTRSMPLENFFNRDGTVKDRYKEFSNDWQWETDADAPSTQVTRTGSFSMGMPEQYVNPKKRVYGQTYNPWAKHTEAAKQKFQKAAWAYEFGQKEDAWSKSASDDLAASTGFDNSGWEPDAYKEWSQWAGRVVTFNWAKSGRDKENYDPESGSYEYYQQVTDPNFEREKFYGTTYGLDYGRWEEFDQTEPEMMNIIRENLGTGLFNGELNLGGDKVITLIDGGGSYYGKTINGSFTNVGTLKPGSQADWMNLGFIEYLGASAQGGGYGNAEGMSRVYIGDPLKVSEKVPLHGEVDKSVEVLQNIDIVDNAEEIVNAIKTWATSIPPRDEKDATLRNEQFRFKYGNVAAGDENWQFMSVSGGSLSDSQKEELAVMILGANADSDDVKQLIQDLNKVSVSILQPDQVGAAYQGKGTMFYNQTTASEVEKYFRFSDRINVPYYDDIAKLEIVKTGADSYTVKGELLEGYDFDNDIAQNTSLERNFSGVRPEEILYTQPFADPVIEGKVHFGLYNFLKRHRELLKEHNLYNPRAKIKRPTYIHDLFMRAGSTQAYLDEVKGTQSPEGKGYKSGFTLRQEAYGEIGRDFFPDIR